MATDHGSDFSCVFDIDANLTVVTGRLCLAQAIARRWLTVPGTLFYAPTYGAGLMTFLSGALLSPDEMETRLIDEALKDERVKACRVSVVIVDDLLKIDAQLTDEDGPFSFTLDVSQTSAKFLMEAA